MLSVLSRYYKELVMFTASLYKSFWYFHEESHILQCLTEDSRHLTLDLNRYATSCKESQDFDQDLKEINSYEHETRQL